MGLGSWALTDTPFVIAGRTFTVNANGRALVSDDIPAAAGSTVVVAITLEPRNGSTVPTLPIYLASPAT